MTIRHVVVWTLASEDEDVKREQAAEIVRRAKALGGLVPSLQSITAGAESVYPGTNADVVLIAEFATVADLEAYQVHPAHVEVASYVRSVVAARAAVDYEI